MHTKTKFLPFICATTLLLTLFTNCSKKQSVVITSNEPKMWKVDDGFSPAAYGGSFDTLKAQKVKELIGEGYTKVRKVKLDESLLMTWRVNAALEIENRASKDDRKSYSEMTQGYWVLDAAYLDEFAPHDVVDGKWIKFNENLTYEYGKFKNTLGKGRYHYHPSKSEIILLDEKQNVRPLEYQIEWSDGYIVIGGTSTYDDEDIMIKMINRQSKPTASK